MDAAAAFDRVAPTYAESVRANPILEGLRARTLAALTARVKPGGRVLELGCGPGLDARELTARGWQVTGIDVSPGMVAAAEATCREAVDGGLGRFAALPVERLDELGPLRFDAVFSNLGPLNCVGNLAATAAAVRERLVEGGCVVASVMGRICPWELVWFLPRGHVRRAAVRFRRGPVPVGLGGGVVPTRYYTPLEFCRVFRQAGFEPIAIRSLAIVVPPPYLEGLWRRLPPRGQRWGWLIEDRVAGWPVVRQAGDHFLAVLQRR